MPLDTAATDGIHYREQGAGAPVIALHGSASAGSQWRSLVGCLEGRFRVITPDLPGYGRSAPLAGPPSLGRVAAAVGALVEAQGEPVHLVGHSFGGAVALKIAAAMPDRVKSLTLIEPAAFHLLRTAQLSDRRLLAEIEGVADTLHRFACEGDAWSGIGRFVDFWNGEGAWRRTGRRLRAAMAGTIEQVLDDLAAVEGERGTLDDLAAVAVPALCVMGLESPVAAMRVTELVARSLPNARLEMLADAGHMAPLTDPHVVDPMIRRHLIAAELGGAPAPAALAAAA
jgi:lipase